MDPDLDYVPPDEISVEEGVFLIKLARKAVKEYLRNGSVIEPPNDTPSKLFKKGMCFVTILKLIPTGSELRGCIGYLQPIEPLIKNVINAAIAAATQDPRFYPMSLNELPNTIFEVSVLSKSVDIPYKGRDRVKGFEIGRDGLVIEYRIYKGLLLPEVPVEYCWDNETFLSETCVKAGLPPDCWLNPKVRVMRFYAKTFREKSPDGDVVLRNLKEEYVRACQHIANLE